MTTYTANKLNQYTSVSAASVVNPVHDDDGNVTDYKNMKYSWNAENQMIFAEPENPAEGDKKTEYLYDYMGRRARKQIYVYSSGGWTKTTEKLFVYDGWNLIKEITKSGGTPSGSKFYVWGLDLSQSLQGAGGIGGLVCAVHAGEVRHFFFDGNGNVGQVVNETGSIVARYEYDPFGNIVNGVSASDSNPFRFSTKYFDVETGLYYYGFRYYSAELGRWWSRDPLGEQGGVNLYGFVINNPINKTDLIGLFDGWSNFPGMGVPMPPPASETETEDRSLKDEIVAKAWTVLKSFGYIGDKAMEMADDYLARQNAYGFAMEIATMTAGPSPLPSWMFGYNAMFFPESCEIAGYKYFNGYFAGHEALLEDDDRIDKERNRNEVYRIGSFGNFVGASATFVTASPVSKQAHNAESWLGWFWNVEGGYNAFSGSFFGGLPIENGENTWIGVALGLGKSVSIPKKNPFGIGVVATYYKYLWDDAKRSVVPFKGCECRKLRAINFVDPLRIAALAQKKMISKSAMNVYDILTK